MSEIINFPVRPPCSTLYLMYNKLEVIEWHSITVHYAKEKVTMLVV